MENHPPFSGPMPEVPLPKKRAQRAKIIVQIFLGVFLALFLVWLDYKMFPAIFTKVFNKQDNFLIPVAADPQLQSKIQSLSKLPLEENTIDLSGNMGGVPLVILSGAKNINIRSLSFKDSGSGFRLSYEIDGQFADVRNNLYKALYSQGLKRELQLPKENSDLFEIVNNDFASNCTVLPKDGYFVVTFDTEELYK